jgi:putative PEP-CTERM system histidine kinase
MDFAVLLSYFSAIAACAVALAVIARGPLTLAHWSFLAGMLVFAAECACDGLAADMVLPADKCYWANWRATIMGFLPGVWLLFGLTYARGDAHQSLRRGSIALLVAFLVPISFGVFFQQNLIRLASAPDIAAGPLLALTRPGWLLHLLFLLGAMLVLMNLERTYRAAVGTMRWRIKFMVLGLSVLFAARAYVSSQVLLFRTLNPILLTVNSAALLLGCLLILRSLLRSGHFEVRVYPSQMVLHQSFTVMLAGIYLVIVGVLARAVSLLGGPSPFELKALVVLAGLVLLAVLLLSDRVRLLTRRFVSRHFQRPLHDYRTVWRTFTSSTTRCVKQTDLCTAMTKLVSDIFQVLSVTVWVLDERKPIFALCASTSLLASRSANFEFAGESANEVIHAFRNRPEPLDLETARETWVPPLRQLQPEEFRHGGNRICVPMVAGAEVLGMMMLGDRVGAAPYSLQDLELLKALGDQAAASLLNIRFSARLAQARQLEGFQAMSAFFVHDLKNTTSTLSLMLQNLPVHFHNPEYRETALEDIAGTVKHLNEMIGRLNELRHELELRAVECDLNELVAEALRAQMAMPGVELVRELKPLPKVRLDPVQIQKVITNLILNARDAVGKHGQIRVQTERQNGWVVLAVADTGCGMTPEFIQERLFRPFQTTKKTGIGIGMFHCQTIVEAHRGRIEVESEPGKGTAFRVLLPVVG